MKGVNNQVRPRFNPQPRPRPADDPFPPPLLPQTSNATAGSPSLTIPPRLLTVAVYKVSHPGLSPLRNSRARMKARQK
jgi:hypothetical protein